ncbi:MAG: DEAD/DEAH box helicase [Kiritimatiellae bacterium]|nr:DEAD/DEAH box helicase [Kiritimatiellia bacterium]
MSPLDTVENLLKARFERQIRAHRALPSEPGRLVPFPAGIDMRLAEVLRADGITQLYAHQAEAFEAVSAGRDTVLVSRTASGKTLAFLLPILSAYCRAEAPFGVLLLYPTKALSRDQEGTLGRLLHAAIASRKLGTFDGDTPADERTRIQRGADFVITNPDMLHAGILPNHHRGWKDFLGRLRYIVVDEVHAYRGAFGSHVANVFRRLLRVCEMHGSHPQFVCCSATVGNPAEHVRALFQRDFQVVAGDSSPRPGRDLYLVNPPLVQGPGVAYRKGTSSVTVPLLRAAASAGVRTICFCKARQQVERLHRAVTDGHPELRERVKPYRGGLLPSERRQLERDLFEGRIAAIITTNALELGIDIGDLDLCLLSGHPGSVASFWQQAGRVGRKGQRALIVFVARDTPVDQYLVNHPEFLLGAPVECAWLNADNPYILLQHLPCAAHEHPLRADEPAFATRAYGIALDVLKEDGTLQPYKDCWRYALPDFPARGVNLRGMTDYNVEIYCGGEVIGEIDPIGARGELYKDAIYQHLGRRYMSLELDLDKKLCRVEPVAVDYYTEAVWESRVELTAEEERKAVRDATLKFGAVHVNKQPKLYKKIRERTLENVGYGPITLPSFEYDTTGFALRPPETWRRAIEHHDRRWLQAALFGLRYILKQVAPGLCLADRGDIETDLSLDDEADAQGQTPAGQQPVERFMSALYLYDAIAGGVGYAEKIFEQVETALSLCREVLTDCECEQGCPACVPPLPPGVEDAELEQFLVESDAARVCTLSLLGALLSGEVTLPEVHTVKRDWKPPVASPPPDTEGERLQARLDRAARTLRENRKREH